MRENFVISKRCHYQNDDLSSDIVHWLNNFTQ